MRTRYIILLAATCLSPAALAQRGGGGRKRPASPPGLPGLCVH